MVNDNPREIIAESLYLSGLCDSTILVLDARYEKVDENTFQRLQKGLVVCDSWLKAYKVYLKDKINLQDLYDFMAIEPFVKQFAVYLKSKDSRKKALEKLAVEFKDAKEGLTKVIEGFRSNKIPSEKAIKKYCNFFEKVSKLYLSYAAKTSNHQQRACF